jgi:hypothetical protein
MDRRKLLQALQAYHVRRQLKLIVNFYANLRQPKLADMFDWRTAFPPD